MMSGAASLRPLIGEQLAGPAHAALDLVEDQQHAGVAGDLAQFGQLGFGQRPRAALALHRLDDHGGRGLVDGGLQGVQVAERQLAVARQARTETVQIAGVARGVDGGVGAAVERAVEADDVDPFSLAVDHVIATRGLQRALDRLGARIGEEHHVGEGVGAQLVGQLFLLGDPVDVGDVPELLALGLQRVDQHGVGVAQAAGGDAGHAVQVVLAGPSRTGARLGLARTPAGRGCRRP
jgi:hypothetical protein